MSDPAPTILVRKPVPTRWGGESWEVYDREDESNLRARGAQVIGSGVRTGFGGRFPLLVKYIDAQERLSVQVHPDEELAKEENDGGKTEAWVVLEAGPRARILCGLKPGTTREAFERVADTEAVEALLCEFKPRPGDAMLVPAGTVHTIGPDVKLFEIQQNSDVTYRFFDPQGREPNKARLQRRFRAVRYDLPQQRLATPEPIAGGGEWLIRDECFRVRRLRVNGPAALGTEGTCKILNVIEGSGTLGWRSGGRADPLELARGHTVLVPACTGTVYVSPAGPLTILWSDPGEPSR